jgi:hypothetical protein
MMRVSSATFCETALPRYERMSACVSCACSGDATLPVPIAHTYDPRGLDAGRNVSSRRRSETTAPKRENPDLRARRQ